MRKSITGLTLASGLILFAMPGMADEHAETPAFEITGDAAAGERVFRRCAACHDIGDGAQVKVGPVLTGVLGRMAGTYDGFAYSDALLAFATAQELVWTPDTLDAFLTKPRDYIAGTNMAYAGLRKEEDRANLIAYLATFPAPGE